jgi:hypothetical protein
MGIGCVGGILEQVLQLFKITRETLTPPAGFNSVQSSSDFNLLQPCEHHLINVLNVFRETLY